MSAGNHSFRTLLPGFVIPAGTQVVLKVAKVLPDGQQFKPPGSVGVVLESPPDNHQPYLVRFADGESVTACFHELALRRREVEEELGEVTEDLRPWIIYRCQVGSKASDWPRAFPTTTCGESTCLRAGFTGHCGGYRNSWSSRWTSGTRSTGS